MSSPDRPGLKPTRTPSFRTDRPERKGAQKKKSQQTNITCLPRKAGLPEGSKPENLTPSTKGLGLSVDFPPSTKPSARMRRAEAAAASKNFPGLSEQRHLVDLELLLALRSWVQGLLHLICALVGV